MTVASYARAIDSSANMSANAVAPGVTMSFSGIALICWRGSAIPKPSPWPRFANGWRHYTRNGAGDLRIRRNAGLWSRRSGQFTGFD